MLHCIALLSTRPWIQQHVIQTGNFSYLLLCCPCMLMLKICKNMEEIEQLEALLCIPVQWQCPSPRTTIHQTIAVHRLQMQCTIIYRKLLLFVHTSIHMSKQQHHLQWQCASPPSSSSIVMSCFTIIRPSIHIFLDVNTLTVYSRFRILEKGGSMNTSTHIYIIISLLSLLYCHCYILTRDADFRDSMHVQHSHQCSCH